MAKRYRVTGAYVTVKTNTTNGPMIVGLYEGAPVPADASDEWLAHHLEADPPLIEEVPVAAKAAKAEEEAEDEGPASKAPAGPHPSQAAQHRGGTAGGGGRP